MPDDFVFNKDLTEAVLEKAKQEIDLAKKVEECGGDDILAFLMKDETPQMIGTVLNEECISKVKEANSILDILEVSDEIEADRFTEPNVKCREAIVAIEVTVACFLKNAQLNALRRLVELADEINIFPRENVTVRIVFVFHNLWKEYREMAEEEIKSEEEITNNYIEEDDIND